MNYFLCVVLFVLAAASHGVAAELIRATYDGYYDYAIVCQDKKWKERNTKLCGEKYSMVSAFEFNGNSLTGTFTAEDSSGSHYTGEYDFSKFSFTDKKSKADAIWRDKWGYGKVNLKTTDDWKTFDGEWFYFFKGEQSIRGNWRGKLATSSSQVSPIMAFATKVLDKDFSSDTKVPTITIASANTKGKQGIIRGKARDNTGIAEVTIDGKQVGFDNSGNFKFETFVPADGKQVTIQVTDLNGLSNSKTVRLDRSASNTTTGITFDSLNPLGRKVAKNKDALALIIGVDGYENTTARAIYADSDAKVFADYANEKLGIPTNRIKTLVNDGADEKGMLLAVKDWLSRASKKDKSDVYVFFAGHGLASQDGKKMYLLPYDGSPRLLDDTAISRDRLFADIAAANPRSVTVFLDTCYSGETRGKEMLIAGRPIGIRALEQSIPDNFTLMTAAAGDQIANPLKEAKHGMFSYFLMKGMEGVADSNQDNKITALELHEYVKENVWQQSSNKQLPELQGDGNRVLVQFQ